MTDKPACPECGKTDWCEPRVGGACLIMRTLAAMCRTGEASSGMKRAEVLAALRKRLPS